MKTEKTILTVEIQYDPTKTDPEGLACAMDRLLETALSTPDILEEYGNLRVGEFFVASETAMSALKPYALCIDGQLLRSQRQLLLKLVDTTFCGKPYAPPANEDRDLFEGIIELLDEIADQAHDRHGIDCLLDDEDDKVPDVTPMLRRRKPPGA